MRRLAFALVAGALCLAAPVLLALPSTNMVLMWEFSSGALLEDSHTNNYDLTNNGGAGVAGVVGNAIEFDTTGNEYATLADNANISCGSSDCAFAFWAHINSFEVSTHRVVEKWDAGSNQTEWRVYVGIGGTLAFEACASGSEGGCHTATSSTSVSAGNTYFIVVDHDAGVDIGITTCVGGTTGSRVSTAHTGNIFDSATEPITLGGTTNRFSGWIDQFVARKGSMFDSTDIATMCNGGAGRTYASIDGGTSAAPHFGPVLGVGK